MKERFGILVGMVTLLTGAGLVFAQESPHDEYEEWQKAKREEAREHREYLGNPKKSNYLDWRSAQRDANREWEEYKLSLEMAQGYPYPRRNVIVVGRTEPVRRTTVVVAGNGYNGNGYKVVKSNNYRVNGVAVGRITGDYDEYEEWMAARREAERERQEFISNPTDDNYWGYKEAQGDVAREYMEYRATVPVRTRYIRASSTRRVVARRAKAKVRRARTCYCR
jgi:hypothetical protein